jgi:hypothetical protein
MNNASREIQICFSLAGIGSLLSFLIFKTQSMSHSWMLPLMLVLPVLSIAFFTAGILVLLRKRPRVLAILGRLAFLVCGLWISTISLFIFPSKTTSSSLENLVGILMFVPLGVVLSLFGLYLDVWLSRVLSISRWRIYRYTTKLCCLSLALGPIVALTLNNTPQQLRENASEFSEIIGLIFPMIATAFAISLNSDSLFRDR